MQINHRVTSSQWSIPLGWSNLRGCQAVCTVNSIEWLGVSKRNPSNDHFTEAFTMILRLCKKQQPTNNPKRDKRVFTWQESVFVVTNQCKIHLQNTPSTLCPNSQSTICAPHHLLIFYALWAQRNRKTKLPLLKRKSPQCSHEQKFPGVMPLVGGHLRKVWVIWGCYNFKVAIGSQAAGIQVTLYCRLLLLLLSKN